MCRCGQLPGAFPGKCFCPERGNMKSAVAILRQLHHGIVVNPEMAEPESAADVLHPGYPILDFVLSDQLPSG